MRKRNGVLQIPVIREVPLPYTGRLHWNTGIRCPRCCLREVVYNGNYFCSGFDDDDCEWALGPHDEIVKDPTRPGCFYDEPMPLWDLVDALVEAGTAAVKKGLS